MRTSKTTGRLSVLLAAIILGVFLCAGVRSATASESGCVTCHLDKEMLQKTAKTEQGKASAMQSGAG